MATLTENRISPEVRAERERFYEKIGRDDYAPLWEQLHSLVTKVPTSACRTAHWQYATARAYLDEAGKLITAKEAERRVLILENPGMRGKAAITPALYAGLQMILPGEVAPAHRHSQSALRLILEGDGAFTTVDGEQSLMKRGDFIITPSWTWHDHGNHTDQPMVWLDGLDVPMVAMLDASFAESGSTEAQSFLRPPGDSALRFGNNMAPVDAQPTPNRASPLFSYAYVDACASLAAMATSGTPDACNGYKLRYLNPLTGGSAMPTIGAYIQQLPAHFASAPYRCSAGTIFAVIEGSVTVTTPDQTFDAGPNDVFVIPSWVAHEFKVRERTVLFSFSDRPVQEALGLWREQRNAN
ncbi:gentisate 1,2-dioxygenase [Noviherbaspirillum saxi]|uniref:Gentisate 1,2-dioxygenase n=1 Tax=Noviherbaspirillum saxi TaxID=2320863 RepID=A0A3A3FGF4_9BURK|nr:gentisate 1,2-dioxygenase [Noviherbaspirillum saxi]RJF92260.1 gentisate 1,2-dioxygenase [Noviherbaspirillum saxi]